QDSMIGPSLRSSGRWNTSSGGRIGSNREDHATALDDSLDMADSIMVKEMAIIGNIKHEQVRLLADFQRSQTVQSPNRSGRVAGQRRERLGRQHSHRRASHRPNQRQVLRWAGAGVAV